MRMQDVQRLFLLASLWGGSFLFMRVAAPAFGAFLTAWLRMLIAAFVFGVYFLMTRPKLELKARAFPYLVMGLLNSAAPFALFCSAELHLSASMGALLNATTPLFAAGLSAVFFAEPLTPKKAGGIAAALLGVILLVGWSPMVWNPNTAGAILKALAAAALYAVGGLYARKKLQGAPSFGMALGSQLGGVLWLAPAIPFALPAVVPPPSAVGCLLALGVLSTAFAYLLFFRLLVDVGPAKTLTVTFLTPLFGMLWAFLFLHEAVTPLKLASCGLILLGTAFVTGFQAEFASRREGVKG